MREKDKEYVREVGTILVDSAVRSHSRAHEEAIKTNSQIPHGAIQGLGGTLIPITRDAYVSCEKAIRAILDHLNLELHVEPSKPESVVARKKAKQ